MRIHRLIVSAALLLAAAMNAHGGEFTFQDGDRVALIGNTLIEREQTYGMWEWGLTLAAADRNVTFKNLGWSGDTVWADSRGIFEAPAQGYARTLELVKELQPTVVVLNYGSVEAFEGAAHLPAFVEQYTKLLNDLQGVSAPNARFVLLGPLDLQSSPLIPNATEYNTQVAEFRAAVQKLATERDATFVPLKMPGGDVTDNGQHLNRFGYILTGQQLTQALCPEGAKRVNWRLVASEPAPESPTGQLLDGIRTRTNCSSTAGDRKT